MTRAEKIAKARELREQGLTQREIARRMGYAKQTVNAWFSDPDGSKLRARKDSYRGTCEECDGPTTGCNGKDQAPRFCHQCAPSAHAVWSRELIIEKMHEWVRLYGRPPGLMDWSPGHIRACRSLTAELKRRKIKRFKAGEWPSHDTVRRYFGDWASGIEAAGYTQNPTRHQGRWEGAA